MYDVFISYAREDGVVAEAIAIRLEQAGFSVFFDQRVIVGGESWTSTFSRELRSARAVLALLSSNSPRSTWLQEELQVALDGKTLVIPVLLDEGAKKNWLWPLLARRQSISLKIHSPDAESQLDRLVQTLSAALRHESESIPLLPGATPLLPRATSAHLRLWTIILVALFSAALGALATWLLIR